MYTFSLVALSLALVQETVSIRSPPLSTTTTSSSRHEVHTRTLIVNGENADPDRYPYFSTLDDLCGGVLIAPDIVLTAGHCKSAHMHHVHPHVGAYSYQDYHESFHLQRAVRHPQFDRNEDFEDMVFDFTIIKLNGASQLSYLQINRNADFPAPHQDVIVLGLGVLGGDTDERPDVLQQVILQTISNDACNAASNDETSYEGRIQESNLCTHTPFKDACDYDSGGPIIALDAHGQEVLVGLVSWGVGCADPDLPAINARVSAAADWIDAMVCALSDDPPKDFRCFPDTIIEQDHPLRAWYLLVGVAGLLTLAVGYTKFRRYQQSHSLLYGESFVDYEDDYHSNEDEDETEFVDGKALFPMVKNDSEYTALTIDGSSSDEDSPVCRNYRTMSP